MAQVFWLFFNVRDVMKKKKTMEIRARKIICILISFYWNRVGAIWTRFTTLGKHKSGLCGIPSEPNFETATGLYTKLIKQSVQKKIAWIYRKIKWLFCFTDELKRAHIHASSQVRTEIILDESKNVIFLRIYSFKEK